tara:strand:+ start:258 stop:464 length:207 start_codon:yes stop_codon:yes gene_type:complete
MPNFNKGGGWSGKFIGKFRSMLGSPFKHPSVPKHENPHEKKGRLDIEDSLWEGRDELINRSEKVKDLK